MESPRLPEEDDAAFRQRAERAGTIAQILVARCLANSQIQRMIEAGTISEKSIRRSPTVRVEFEQAVAIGGIGETLEATKNKHWGAGPSILPLEPDDEFDPVFITYLYRSTSLYNRRFEQRRRLKELLGRTHRKLVGNAKYFTKTIFLRDLTADQAVAIRRCIHLDAGTFWRAVQGKVFLDLPKRATQLYLPFE